MKKSVREGNRERARSQNLGLELNVKAEIFETGIFLGWKFDWSRSVPTEEIYRRCHSEACIPSFSTCPARLDASTVGGMGA